MAVREDGPYTTALMARALVVYFGHEHPEGLASCQAIVAALLGIAAQARELRVTADELSLSAGLALPMASLSAAEFDMVRTLFDAHPERVTFASEHARCPTGFHLRVGTGDVAVGCIPVVCAFWVMLREHFAHLAAGFAAALFDAVVRGVLQSARVEGAALFAALRAEGYEA